jgi:hypothetical protein
MKNAGDLNSSAAVNLYGLCNSLRSKISEHDKNWELVQAEACKFQVHTTHYTHIPAKKITYT